MKRFINTLSIALLVTTGCSHTESTAPEAQAIRDTETKWNHEIATRDVDRLLEHYTQDAVLLIPGTPPSVGRRDIRKVLAEIVRDPALSLKFSAARIEVATSGDFGYSQGSYLMTMTDPHTRRVVHDHGSYVTTYRREIDGSWKAVTDIATSEAGP